MEPLRWLERVFGLVYAAPIRNGLRMGPALGRGVDYVSVTNRFFRTPRSPAESVALIADQSEGTLIEVQTVTLRRIAGILAWAELAIVGTAPLLALSAMLSSLAWLALRLFAPSKASKFGSVRAFSLLASVSMIAMLVFLMGGFNDPIDRLGRCTVWSIGYSLFSVVFALCAFAGLAQALRRHSESGRLSWWHGFIVSAALSILSGYMLYWGAIGWRSWV
jgi:hypothetical protein